MRGLTSPNPWVGAVAGRDGIVTGVGATAPGGGPHAEAAALAASAGRADTLFVTLEPCAPFAGKRNPPCADAIIDAGIGRVVVALADPDPNVAGRGVARLREAGVEVELGDGLEAAIELLRPYIKHRQTGRPYVVAKFAASLDGRVTEGAGAPSWLTGEAARDRAHQERARVDAVLVGSGTILADNPLLTARPGGVATGRQPVRIVVDGRGRTPASSRLFGAEGPVVVATSGLSDPVWRKAIAARGAQVVECEASETGIELEQLLTTLGARGIMSIWAEGGPTLLGSLFEGGHVDEVWAFLAPVILGGGGRPAIAGRGGGGFDAQLLETVVETLGEDVLVRGYTGAWSPYNDLPSAG